MKLKDIDGIIASTRSLIVQKIVEVSEISGVTVEGDKETERDEYASRHADTLKDAEIEVWDAMSSQLALAVESTVAVDQVAPLYLTRSADLGTWPLMVLPCRSTTYIDRPKLMDSLMPIIMGGAKGGDIPVAHPYGTLARFPLVVALLGSSVEGGEGKSEVACELCHRIAKRATGSFECMGWLDASDGHSLLRSYRRLAHRIQLTDSSFCKGLKLGAINKKKLLQYVNRWLTRLEVSWLLVIDNLDLDGDLAGVVAPVACTVKALGATVLVTSRCDQISFSDKWTRALKTALLVGDSMGWGESTTGGAATENSSSKVQQRRLNLEENPEWQNLLRLETLIMEASVPEDDVWRMCHEVLGREVGFYDGLDDEDAAVDKEKGVSDPRQLRSVLRDLCSSVHHSPLALLQAFSCCLEVYRHRRLIRCQGGRSTHPESIPISYLSRVKEYSLWLAQFNEVAERDYPSLSRRAALYKTFLTAHSVACEKAGGRTDALVRCLELCAFLSPHSVDLRMLNAWLRPPYSPIVVKVHKKWRLPVVAGSGNHDQQLPFEHAEFELVAESFLPVRCVHVGQRFSWRVHRTFADIKAAHMAAKMTYSPDMANCVFPNGTLPQGVSAEVLEDAVSSLRAQLSAFFSSLVQSECWGRVCLSRPFSELLSFTGQLDAACFGRELHSDANVYVPPIHLVDDGGFDVQEATEVDGVLGNAVNQTFVADPFLKLVDPLFSLGFVNILQIANPFIRPTTELTNQDPRSQGSDSYELKHSTPPPNSYLHVQVSFSRDLQACVRDWLRVAGRHDQAIADVTHFLLTSFKAAYAQYKKEFATRDVTVGGKLACEELMPHVMNVLSIAATSTNIDCFELCTIVYHFTVSEGLFDDAVFCATRCVEIIKDRSGSNGPSGELDGQWHGYLADMFCRLNKSDEARALYDHALSIFKKCCGPIHRHTLSVLERLGRLLFEQGKYKHATRVLEEALFTARQLFAGNIISGSSNSNSAVNAANSLHIADRIEQLVRVMAVDAPDSAAVSRCLELKQEELEILRKVKGEYSPSVARCLNSIGELERRQGRSQRAEACFEDSLDILARCVESDSPELVGPLYNLGLEQHSCRKLAEAQRLYKRALEIKEKSMQKGARVDASIASIHDSLGVLFSEQNKYEDALSHLQKACDMYLCLYGKDNYQVALSLNNLAYAWKRIGDNTVARSLYARALSTLRTVGSRSDEDTIASTLNALGELWVAAKNYEEAKPLYMEALTIRVKLYGERHRDTLAVMKNLCVLCHASGAIEEAKELCTSALAIQASLTGPNSEGVADLTCQMAEILRRNEKLEEAKAHYKRAISILRSIHGNGHPSVALQLNNLASVLFSMNNYDDCKVLYEESRKVLTAFHGKEHLSVAASLNNLAELSKHLGKYTEALAYHEQCLDVRLRLLGPEHPTVALSLSQVADVLRLEGSLDGAIDACSQCLGIRIKFHGMEHEDVVDSLKQMAQLMVAKNEEPEARRLLQDALSSQEAIDAAEIKQSNNAILRKAGGSLGTAIILEAICDLTKDHSELDEKIKMLERALKIRRTLQGEEHADVAVILTSLGTTCSDSGNYQEAIDFHQIARAIREKWYGEDHASPVGSVSHIADCLKSLGRLDEALSMHEHCVSSLRTFYGENHPDVAAAMLKLAEILQMLEEYPSALAVCESALFLNSRLLGEDSVEVASNYKLAGDLRRCLGSAKEARANYIKALTIYRRYSKYRSSVEVAETMAGTCWALDELGLSEEASAMRVEMVAMQKRVFGSMHPRIAQELNSIGRALRTRGKLTEASDHFNRALTIGLVTHGENHENTVHSLEGMAGVLVERGKHDNAAPLWDRAAAIRKSLGMPQQHREGLGDADASKSGPSVSFFGTLSNLLSGKME